METGFVNSILFGFIIFFSYLASKVFPENPDKGQRFKNISDPTDIRNYIYNGSAWADADRSDIDALKPLLDAEEELRNGNDEKCLTMKELFKIAYNNLSISEQKEVDDYLESVGA